MHAKSNESKKQVELAKLEYMLPRLTRQWTHLERQMGGTGTRGGPGEKQIEIDRRLIRKNIDKLKKDLFNFRFQKTNGQLTSPSKVKESRKTIARLKTLVERKFNA
jgi:ribosomal protein L29